MRRLAPVNMKVSPYFKDKIKLEAIKNGMTIMRFTEWLSKDDKEVQDIIKKKKERRDGFGFRL